MLTDNQLLKYSRQIMLSNIDIDGQEKLLSSHVLVVGLGGLGSPVAIYLASSGVGELTLVDDDKVDLSNLQRQIIHSTKTLETLKVDSAKKHLLEINPDCRVNTLQTRLSEDEFEERIKTVSVVVDCSDNFETRFMLNRICFKNKTPLVSGAAIRWEGQISTFTMEKETGCYECLYSQDSEIDQSCAHNGVIAPLVGVIGSMQALEVIKLITQSGALATNRLLLFDALQLEWQTIRFNRKDTCPICS